MEISDLVEKNQIITWSISAGFALVLYFVLLAVQKICLNKGTVRAQKTSVLWDDLLIEIIRNIKKYFIFALCIYIGLIWLKLPPRPRLLVDKAFIIISIIQITKIAGILINFWLNKYLKNKYNQDLEMASTIGLISIGIKFFVYSLLLLLALNNIGVNVSTLIAGLGVGGIAIALALQSILTDLFSSLTIILDKPFIVGDFIIVNDLMGTVEHIGLKTTRIRSLSGEQLVFGNGDLLQSRIKNYKRMAERRVVQNITVTYQTKAEQLEVIPSFIKSIIVSQEKTRFERCHFLRFQDSWLEFELIYWVESPDFNDYADKAHAINIAIFRKFAEEKIDFAYPTQTLFVQANAQEPNRLE